MARGARRWLAPDFPLAAPVGAFRLGPFVSAGKRPGREECPSALDPLCPMAGIRPPREQHEAPALTPVALARCPRINICVAFARVRRCGRRVC